RAHARRDWSDRATAWNALTGCHTSIRDDGDRYWSCRPRPRRDRHDVPADAPLSDVASRGAGSAASGVGRVAAAGRAWHGRAETRGHGIALAWTTSPAAQHAGLRAVGTVVRA